MEEEIGPVRAPELDGAIAWLNTPEPLTLAQLRGKIVLLDFWTYGCINCLHVLPDLQRLQAKFADILVVIGVHAAKFDNERSTENIRRTLQRLGIRHPVANDAAFHIWQAYTVRAWPTQVLIDPRGYVVGTATGEGHGAQLEEVITAVAAVFEQEGLLDRTPRPLSPEDRAIDGPLAFPGKVLADEAGGRLFIADTQHHRIVETDLEGRLRRVFGSGIPGRDYGAAGDAQFREPQGMALAGDVLWVADAGNHLVRRIDLASGQVSTVAGTGRQSTWQQTDGGAALETSLNSPWDLAWDGRLLFIAMAGPHQLWLLDPDRGLVIRYAGTGAEGRADGHVDTAAFAQPSGLALADRTLYVADAEANIVRAVALPPENTVRTIAGGDLFEFGDVDGVGDEARFQHPLGLAVAGGQILVADTYNHRIRRLDPTTGRVQSWVGSGRPGHVDGAAGAACFYEPGGLSATSRHVYVADTNNHAVRVVDLATGVVRTLEIR
ncbi:thioredoxin-like domain-containing protein [Luteitalea sp.]|jgi:DNA-binding beta-propeller fold protein YncE|uniref:thioredoxin-like domain-containing protein n=1 Tax=Luteitalea sp. TaxID=2004800 RepID=UPI0037CC166A